MIRRFERGKVNIAELRSQSKAEFIEFGDRLEIEIARIGFVNLKKAKLRC